MTIRDALALVLQEVYMYIFPLISPQEVLKPSEQLLEFRYIQYFQDQPK